MIKVNDNFHELADMYLFSEVGKRVRNFRESHPTTDVVRMDIGDVTLPMFPSVAEEMTRAIADMRSSATFKGYGPEQGYGFMRELISEYDYRHIPGRPLCGFTESVISRLCGRQCDSGPRRTMYKRKMEPAGIYGYQRGQRIRA